MKYRVTSLILAVLACLMLLCGCGGEKYEPKTYILRDMTITLNDSFKQKVNPNYDGVYVSQSIGVYITETEFEDMGTDLEKIEDISLTEYAEGFIDGNNLKTSVVLDQGLITFTYDIANSGKYYTYYNVVYKSAESFWLVQFATLRDTFEEHHDTIRDFAWSVTFGQ